MRTLKSLRIVFIIVWGVNLFLACGPKVVKHQIDEHDYGCKQPPASVFTSAGVDINFAKSTFGNVVIGDINIKTEPEVIALASKAATDAQIKSYLRCLLIKRDGYTPEQAAYFDQINAFLQTKPTTEQYKDWHEKTPFPKK